MNERHERGGARKVPERSERYEQGGARDEAPTKFIDEVSPDSLLFRIYPG